MTLSVRVEGGTGAGVKRPLLPKPAAWMCACGETHPGHFRLCPQTSQLGGDGAGFRRPE